MSSFSDRRRGRVYDNAQTFDEQPRESGARHENRFSGSKQTLIRDRVTIEFRAAEDLPLA